MLTPQALFKGIVARLLPTPSIDGTEVERFTRMGRYGDVKVESAWPTDHLLADEGAYVVATMQQAATALQLGISASYSATAAAFVLQNSDSSGGKSIYPRHLKLCVNTVPTSAVDWRYSIVLDSKDRTPTTISNGAGGTGPGTPATVTAYRAPVVCTNQGVSPTIIGVPYFPLSTSGGAAPTVPSAGSFARTIVGQSFIKNSIPVAKDQYIIQFGCADNGGTFQAAAALSKIVEHAPPIVIGPGQTMLIYMWGASNATAGIAFDDVQLAWIEK